ncbi:unnamed protein product [Adineta ricciae]|uniref:Uncharacterized protein n=1 Tax=Adineta ricciae TaxID=249248 RepID=A0A813YS64_ADIRI|nr:unnamed protein product [Adineta ricciae]CAF1613949.1 unnamed protein product [Adineta ricciae]
MDASSRWKALLVLGILLSLIAFILGWIGFGVPDWHTFQRYSGSITEYYGLWAYCQEQTPLYNTVCQRWSTAEAQVFNGTRPNFISTAQGLITTGMILLSLGLATAIAAAILPLLAYLAAALAIMAFIFLVIGLPIFGRQSNDYSNVRGDYYYNKRYGFWLMVPTIILEFLAALLFLGAALLYRKSGYGNIGTNLSSKTINMRNPIIGGQRMLGPAYGFRPPVLPPVPYSPRTEPSLLSQYLTQRVIPYDRPPSTLRIVGALPQPSIVRATGVPVIHSAPPAYYRFGEPVGPPFKPIVNLTSETIVGPLIRTA